MSTVSLFDAAGGKLGAKQEALLDDQDIYRVVLVLLVNSKGEILLQQSTGKLTVSAIGPIRERERPEQAALRLLKDQLEISSATLTDLGERQYTIGPLTRFCALFICRSDAAVKGTWMRKLEVHDLLKREQERFSPFFYVFWKQGKIYI